MTINVNTIFSSSDYLRYPPLHALVADLIKTPSEDKSSIAKKFQSINPHSAPHVSRLALVLKKIWHQICLRFSKHYRESFRKAVAIIQLSLKHNSAAEKVQKVYRGHLARRQVKLAKETERKKRLAALIQSAVRGLNPRGQLEQARSRAQEAARQAARAAALNSLRQLRQRNRVRNGLKTLAGQAAEHAIAAKRQNKAEVESQLQAFLRYRTALANYTSSKQKYDRYFDTAAQRWRSFLYLEDKKVTEAKVRDKAHYEQAEKELNEAKASPAVLGFRGDLNAEIERLEKCKADFEVSIARLGRFKERGNAPLPSPAGSTAGTVANSPGTDLDARSNPQAAASTTPRDRTPAQTAAASTSPSPPPGDLTLLNPAYDISHLRSPKGSMLSAIAAFIHKDLKLVWDEMFKKCDPANDKILSWNCDDRGTFKMQLSHAIKLWVPSTNEQGQEDPKGGVVLMLGEPDGMICGKLDRPAKTMNFTKGFNVHCHYHVPLPLVGEIPVTPQVFRLVYQSRDRVLFGAGLEIFGKKLFKDRVKSIEYLLTNWGTNGEVVQNDHESYIRRKKAER